MSAPHAAGVAALYLEKNPSWSPQCVKDALLNDAVSGRIQCNSVECTTPNLLLNTDRLTQDAPSLTCSGDKDFQCLKLKSTCTQSNQCCGFLIKKAKCVRGRCEKHRKKNNNNNGRCRKIGQACKRENQCCSRRLTCIARRCQTRNFTRGNKGNL